MKLYTVFGIYCDNMQRHATHVRATDAIDAERRYRRRMERRGERMLVAAVVEGALTAIDPFCNSRAMDDFV